MIKAGAEPSIHRLWSRELREWEKMEQQSLVDFLHNIVLQESWDMIIWKKGECAYKPSLGYNLIVESDNNLQSWSLLWKQKVPPKAKLFVWQAIHKALPTLHTLRSRGIISNSTCKWCMKDEEDTNHLIWSCTLAKSCWEIITRWYNLDTPLPHFRSMFDALKYFNKASQSQGGGTCLISMLWTLW